MFGRVPGTRPNISESHSEVSTRVPFCIATGATGATTNKDAADTLSALWFRPQASSPRVGHGVLFVIVSGFVAGFERVLQWVPSLERGRVRTLLIN